MAGRADRLASSYTCDAAVGQSRRSNECPPAPAAAAPCHSVREAATRSAFGVREWIKGDYATFNIKLELKQPSLSPGRENMAHLGRMTLNCLLVV